MAHPSKGAVLSRQALLSREITAGLHPQLAEMLPTEHECLLWTVEEFVDGILCFPRYVPNW